MGYFITGDEHYGNRGVIKNCNRPFENTFEMDREIMRCHNDKVRKNDIVIHAGDTSFHSNYKFVFENYISKLNGIHIFLRGSHDKWLKNTHCHEIWEKTIEEQYIVVCHYAMLVWPRSHYGSWQLFAHSHTKLNNLLILGKQHDIGVDNNNFYPFSFEEIKTIMKNKPDNFNLIKKNCQSETSIGLK